MRRTGRIVAAVYFALVAGTAAAHHSFRTQYDAEQPLVLVGIVTKVEWMNPHVYVYIDVETDGGAIEAWSFEMGAPHLLQRRGWKRNTLVIGDTVTVDGTRARDGSRTANALKVTLTETGRVLGAASSQTQTIE
jgi:hypothetical protein